MTLKQLIAQRRANAERKMHDDWNRIRASRVEMTVRIEAAAIESKRKLREWKRTREKQPDYGEGVCYIPPCPFCECCDDDGMCARCGWAPDAH